MLLQDLVSSHCHTGRKLPLLLSASSALQVLQVEDVTVVSGFIRRLCLGLDRRPFEAISVPFTTGPERAERDPCPEHRFLPLASSSKTRDWLFLGSLVSLPSFSIQYPSLDESCRSCRLRPRLELCNRSQSLQPTVEGQGTESGKSTLKARWLEHLHDMRSGYVGLKQSQSHLQQFHTERTGGMSGRVSTGGAFLLLFSLARAEAPGPQVSEC